MNNSYRQIFLSTLYIRVRSKLKCSEIMYSSGVPPEVVGDFNYYNPVIDSEKVPDQHADFVNETGTVHIDKYRSCSVKTWTRI